MYNNRFILVQTTSEIPSHKPGLYFDEKATDNPYNLYMNGIVSFVYELSQNAIESDVPTIKCDTIDARTVLKLHESDIFYFYEPDLYLEEVIDGEECWKIVYNVPYDYTFPNGQLFELKDYTWGMTWSLTYNSTTKKWNGNNLQNRMCAKVSNTFAGAEGMIDYYVRHDENMGKWMLGMFKEPDTVNYAEKIIAHVNPQWYYINSSGVKTSIPIENITYYQNSGTTTKNGIKMELNMIE